MALEEDGLACISLWAEAVAKKLELLDVCASTESVDQKRIISCCEVD